MKIAFAPNNKRPAQILEAYAKAIDVHLNDLVTGKADSMLDIEDFATLLYIHPTHLSNTIKEVTGTSACGIYQLKIIDVAHTLLNNTKLSIKDIATLLTFEPSQFTKWFRRFHGITPKAYRQGKAFSIKY